MKLTINQLVAVYDKSTAGVPFTIKTGPKAGKPYKKQTVKFAESGDKMVTVCLWDSIEKNLGDVLEGTIEERDWQGKKYYDFKAEKKEDKVNDRFSAIEFSIANINRKIGLIVDEVKRLNPDSKLTSAGTPVPTFERPNTPQEAKEFGEKMDAYERPEPIIDLVEDELASLDALAEQHFNEA